MDKTRPNSLVTVEQAYNLLRNPLPKDQVEAIEKQVDNLERYTTVNSFFHRKPTVNTNSADTVPPLVANTPYVPGGFVFARKPHAPTTPLPNELPHDHMLEEDHTATRVGALSVSPEPVTPTQSSSNSPNTDVITPYSVLKFAERLPTDSSSDLNKLMKPKSLHNLDDVDVIIDWIAEYIELLYRPEGLYTTSILTTRRSQILLRHWKDCCQGSRHSLGLSTCCVPGSTTDELSRYSNDFQ
ncbi:hypothetical protein GEMRC1_000148 [Eukaryota sp. GEM-RC1]